MASISNDPEMERLGANASATHALQYWTKLSTAARLDSNLYDALWDDWSSPPPSDSLGRDPTVHDLSTSSLTFLTPKLDNLLYGRYKSNFAVQSLSLIGDSPSSSSSSTPSASLHTSTWRSLLIATEGAVPDFSFMTLIREDAMKPFYMNEEECCPGMLIVPRAQFYFVEIARCKEKVRNELGRAVHIAVNSGAR